MQIYYIYSIMTKQQLSNWKEFGKWLTSFLFNCSYIIRKLLYNAVSENSWYINGIVLDFWCGEKPYKNLFKYKEYIGVDYKNSWHDNSMNCIDIYWDWKKIPIKDETFDSFICTEVLEHIFDINLALSEIWRVTKKWGKWIITIPFFVWEHEVPYDFARYTYFWIEDILKKNNFKIIKHERLWNSYTTLLQLCLVFITQSIPRKYLGRYLSGFLQIIFNIIFNTLSLFNFSRNKNSYLNNFILVEKV